MEIAISRKWSNAAASLMGMSKAIEKRMWPFEHPLAQFSLKRDLLYNLQQWADELSVREIAAQSAKELGTLIHMNEQHGDALLQTAKQFPSADISWKLRPLAPDLLKVDVEIRPAFTWSNRTHGSSEPFWLWIEDHTGLDILQWFHSVFRPTTKVVAKEFMIPIPATQHPPSITIRFISDIWIGAEDAVTVPFDQLVMPAAAESHSPLLDLPLLGPQVFRNEELQSRMAPRLRKLNGIQTQSFFRAYNTKQNVLLSAPSASGKTLLGLLTAW